MHTFTFQPGQVTSWLADALDEARLNLPRGEVKYVYNEEGSSVALSPRAKARVVYDLTQMLNFCHESDEPESVDAIKAALAVLR